MVVYKHTAAVLFVLATIIPVRSDEVATLGSGSNLSCGRWVERRKTDSWHEQANWALGFLSGMAIGSTDLDPLNGLDSDAVLNWLDNYCRANPLERFSHALLKFVGEHPR
jgi:hypothetical protein